MSRSIYLAALPRLTVPLACLLLIASRSAQAQVAPSAPKPFVEEIRQQERSVDELQRPPAKVDDKRLPEKESLCFRIDRLVLAGEPVDDFQWVLAAASGSRSDDSPIGRCLGTNGINIVLSRLQQALIARGWVTTRVLAAPQDLTHGTLTLSLIPSRIAAIRFAEDASARNWLPSLRNAIPAQPDDLLNLHDIEQGLENLKRLPTAEADIQIEPSQAANARPGDSDLVVKYTQRSPLRTTLSLDDSGTRSTGKVQSSGDNPLGLNDLFYVSLNHDAFNHKGSGTSGQTVHYSVPYGYWLLAATASQSKYHRTIEGLNQSYVYSGESRNAEVKLSRLVYRDASRKTTVALKGFRRASNSDICDTEIEVQRRVVAGWEASMSHKEFIGESTLEGTLAYKRGTHAFGALRAPEDDFDEGTSYMRMVTAELSANVPFKFGDQKLRYLGFWRAQWNRTQLTPQDRFSIGGRYTGRGFDGENLLLGDRGWLFRRTSAGPWGRPAPSCMPASTTARSAGALRNNCSATTSPVSHLACAALSRA